MLTGKCVRPQRGSSRTGNGDPTYAAILADGCNDENILIAGLYCAPSVARGVREVRRAGSRTAADQCGLAQHRGVGLSCLARDVALKRRARHRCPGSQTRPPRSFCRLDRVEVGDGGWRGDRDRSAAHPDDPTLRSSGGSDVGHGQLSRQWLPRPRGDRCSST